jgi:FMN phosphatase YigB (HAD superfamily)
LITTGQSIPEEVVPKLLHRFTSNEGYTLYDDIRPLFAILRDARAHLQQQPAPPPSTTASAQWPWARTIVGIITNSDDRVPDILRSFGLRVGPRRVGKRQGAMARADLDEDISFVVVSYDAGFEKPNHRIYDAAVWMLEECLAAEAKEGRDMSSEEFEKLMVGDDLEKDVNGPREAGWSALLLDRGLTRTVDEDVDVIGSLTDIGSWRPRPDEESN